MCGRTSLANLPDHLRPFLQRHGVRDVPPWYTPRYNVAPSQDLMVIVESDGVRDARRMKWGLVPGWAKDPAIGSRMINARCETAATKPAYREAFAKRRGLIVVDSYYEWRKNPSGAKTPFRIHRADGGPFTIAALWERWGVNDDRMETCAVITTEANEVMGRIHHRMPVIVSDEHASDWLSDRSPAEAVRCVIADSDNELESVAVSLYVNSPGNDDQRCWEPSPESGTKRSANA
ncbi:MAG: SOS response-associated peptidase [Gemmatimonadota bacterium]|nr:SOS response-associated peptidase [Gemmatimonadota bacterium]